MATLHVKQHNRATITATGTSPIFRNPGGSRHHLVIDVPSAPTGTSPTLTFEVDVSTDGVTFTRKGPALTAISAVGNQFVAYGPGTTQGAITEPYLQIKWTIGGTGSPTFTNVTTMFSAVDC